MWLFCAVFSAACLDFFLPSFLSPVSCSVGAPDPPPLPSPFHLFLLHLGREVPPPPPRPPPSHLSCAPLSLARCSTGNKERHTKKDTPSSPVQEKEASNGKIPSTMHYSRKTPPNAFLAAADIRDDKPIFFARISFATPAASPPPSKISPLSYYLRTKFAISGKARP